MPILAEMMWLIALSFILAFVWLHGLLRTRWYRRELERRPDWSGQILVPGLISPIAAPGRVRAELARAERTNTSVHVARARLTDAETAMDAARNIADSLTDDMLGVLWDATTVLVIRSAAISLGDLPHQPNIDWTLRLSSRPADMELLVAA